MSDPTAQELLDIALINRARLDPTGEATRFGITLNEGLPAGTISATSKQPLAFASQLGDSARQHSQSMITNDYFAHNDPTVAPPNDTPFARMANAGYSGSKLAENIAARGTTETLTNAKITSEIILEHQSLFVDSTEADRGHRTNIMDEQLQQIGTGVATGVTHNVFGDTFNTTMLTEDFGTPSSGGQFITGIAYNDTDADNFYSVGEGRGGISVATPGGTFTTGTAGGYSGAVSAGAPVVTFSGGGLGAPVSLQVVVTAGRNVLVNLVGQSTIETSASMNDIRGITKIVGLGNIGLTLAGDKFDDTIIGSKGNDTIKGGVGHDTMSGGLGNDKFFVDSAGDTVNEASGEGTDTVLTSVSYALKAGSSIETLAVDIATSTTTVNLAGNSFNNTLIGNGGHNAFDGGAGVDTIDYSGRSAVVSLQLKGASTATATVGGAAEDTVRNIENINGGTASDTLTGDNFANVLRGNGGNDHLNGALGNDTMFGGAGNDTFIFNTNATGNLDTISDFNVPEDTISLENAVFTVLTATGTLAPGFFFKGAAAHDADDHIIYNPNTGALIYDSNGNAAGGSIQFAKLATDLLLTNNDFVVT